MKNKIEERIENLFHLTDKDLKIPTDYDLDQDITRVNWHVRILVPLLKVVTKKKIKLYVKYKWKRLIYIILKYLFLILVLFSTYKVGFWLYDKYQAPKMIKQKIEVIHNYTINNPIAEENLIFMNSMAMVESNGDYNATKGQYWGKYQIGELGRKELGISCMNQSLFINDQYIQDWAMNELINVNYKYLEKYIIKYQVPTYGGVRIGNYVVTISGLIAAAHLTGYSSVVTFLESNGKTIATDGNNVPLTKYFMFNNMKLKFK